MKGRISDLIDELFADVPYSKQSDEARKKVADALGREYDSALTDKRSELQALGSVMERYGTLDDAAALAGYANGELGALGDEPSRVRDRRFLRRSFYVFRAGVIIGALFLTLAVTFVFAAIMSGVFHIIPLMIALAGAAGMFLLCRHEIVKMSFETVVLAPSARDKLEEYLDRFKKRAINSLLIFAFTLTIFAGNAISCALYSDFNGAELWALILACLAFPALGLFLCLKNALYLLFLSRALSAEKRRQIGRYYAKCAVICAAFLVGCSVISFILGQFFDWAVTFYYIATEAFVIAFTAVNLKKRSAIVSKNLRVNRPRIAVIALACALAVTVGFMKRDLYTLTPYIMTVSEVEHTAHEIEYDRMTGEYTIAAGDGDFKILHLTDIHLGGSMTSSMKDFKALDACYKLIRHTKPDLVIVTGDMVFPMGIMSFSLNNQSPVTQFASFMRNVGIPWAFTFGNHDTEAMATGDRSDICAMYEQLAKSAPGTLLYPDTQPEITGRSNQLIRLVNSDGSLRQMLFLIDSNDYTGNGVNEYDYIHDDQVEWYADRVKDICAAEGRTVPSMLFFHIPLQEYREAYELYQAGSDEVKYHFGIVGETMIDAICCSDYPSKLFDTALALGSTQAMFCGHDHYNNISLEYKGIRLTYGMSIDYLAMPGIAERTEQRGAEVITVSPSGDFTLEQVKLTEIEG